MSTDYDRLADDWERNGPDAVDWKARAEAAEAAVERWHTVYAESEIARDDANRRIDKALAICDEAHGHGFAWEREWPDGVYAVDIAAIRAALHRGRPQ